LTLHDALPIFRQSREIDDKLPDNEESVTITEEGEPIVRKAVAKASSSFLAQLELLIEEKMPERNIIDILCNVEYWVNWIRHFGALSGSVHILQLHYINDILYTFIFGCTS